MRKAQIVAAALAAGAALVPAAFAAAGAGPRMITVSGTGVVSTIPTQGEFTFGVSANGATASAALAADAQAMSRVIGVLKDQGVAAADIQTAMIQLSPNTSPNGSKIVNYTATNSVTARIANLGKAGPIIDGAVRAGANLVSGPSLTSADERRLSRAALAAAVEDARGRARAIAAAAGVRLGPVRSVSESGTTPPQPLSGAAAAKSETTTPVEPGTVRIEADVTVTFGVA
jgi:uncharacterized protein